MIRLVALRNVLQNISAAQATMLSCGNSSYINLMKYLPNVLPYPTWYSLVKVQLLSGIKPREINSRLDEPLNHTCMHRIRKHPEIPQAIYCLDNNISLEFLLPTAKQFYYSVLKPLQLPYYPEVQDSYMLWFWIRSLSRNTPLGLIYIHDKDVNDMLKIMQSQPNGSKGFFLQRYGYTHELCKSIGVQQNTAKNYKIIDDSKSIELSEHYKKELERVYDLLYNIRTVGIVNDTLMEAGYEYIL